MYPARGLLRRHTDNTRGERVWHPPRLASTRASLIESRCSLTLPATSLFVSRVPRLTTCAGAISCAPTRHGAPMPPRRDAMYRARHSEGQ